MAYKDLVKNITRAVENKFTEISARYNFDNGEEFEIALCELLKLILPIKYGVCRGFAVTQDDMFAGDDIIIYDRERFPTIRLLEDNKFDKKHEIPIEAVYMYIEAKNTLILEGQQANYIKALKQVVDFKKLERQPRKNLSIDHRFNFGEMFQMDSRPKWPNIANPMYTAIISRNFQQLQKGELSETTNYILNEINQLPSSIHSPDLLICGQNLLFLPEILDDESENSDSPFVNQVNKLTGNDVTGKAFGIGIVTILYALDNIRLGQLPFSKIINNSICS